jgi:hypothetical protein
MLSNRPQGKGKQFIQQDIKEKQNENNKYGNGSWARKRQEAT